MIGSCKICQQLILAPPVPHVGPGRDLAEYSSLIEAARQHLFQQHFAELQPFTAILHDLARFFAGLLVTSALGEFDDQQSQHRQRLLQSLEKLSVVEVAGHGPEEKDEPCQK